MRKNELSEQEIKEIRWRIDGIIAAVFEANDELRSFDRQYGLHLPKRSYGVFSGGLVTLLRAMNYSLEVAALLGIDKEPHIARRVAERRRDVLDAETSRERFMGDGLL